MGDGVKCESNVGAGPSMGACGRWRRNADSDSCPGVRMRCNCYDDWWMSEQVCVEAYYVARAWRALGGAPVWWYCWDIVAAVRAVAGVVAEHRRSSRSVCAGAHGGGRPRIYGAVEGRATVPSISDVCEKGGRRAS